jgi:hypothetical protein
MRQCGIPALSPAGSICTAEAQKKVVKTTITKGASLENPSRLFNSSPDGNTRRASDFADGDKIDEMALKTPTRAAAAPNQNR